MFLTKLFKHLRVMKPVLVIMGSTGSGKSKLAIEMAIKFNGEIINADAMQMYEGLDIVTNKVTKQELSKCPHHMMSFLDPHNCSYSIINYKSDATKIIKNIHNQNKLPIIVGGTNYYIESLLWDFVLPNNDDTATTNDEKRNKDEKEVKSDLKEKQICKTINFDLNYLEKEFNQNEFKNSSFMEKKETCKIINTKKIKLENNNEINIVNNKEIKIENNKKIKNENKNVIKNNININIKGKDTDYTNNKKVQDESEFNTEATYNLTLHQQLQQIDPERAQQLHPNDIRKIKRALEVYNVSGRTMTSFFQQQQQSIPTQQPYNPTLQQKLFQQLQQFLATKTDKKDTLTTTSSSLRGRLSYDNICMIWIRSDQEILNKRLDGRVDEMVKTGLIDELTSFHCVHNAGRINSELQLKEYHKGILQSIGLKELHKYLMCPHKNTCDANDLLKQGIDEMKTATRKYSKKQVKWIKSRFLKDDGKTVQVPIYEVDSTYPEQWQERVHMPASEIVAAFLKGITPETSPVQRVASDNTTVHRRCHECDKVFIKMAEWKIHMGSRKHKKRMRKINKCNNWSNDSDPINI